MCMLDKEDVGSEKTGFAEYGNLELPSTGSFSETGREGHLPLRFSIKETFRLIMYY